VWVYIFPPMDSFFNTYEKRFKLFVIYNINDRLGSKEEAGKEAEGRENCA